MKLPDISKITPPLLPQVVNRPRLLNILEKNKNRRLILILGQAAQGKSTLAASYAKTSKTPTAWMNLGEEDSDPVDFFYLMGQSLQHVLKDVDFSRFLSFPATTSGPVSEMAFFREWARSLFERVPHSTQVVMDGLDHLSPDAPTFKVLQILIEEARPHILFILLSREIPPLSLEFQHLKVRQEALILTNEELAFTLAETREYLGKVQRIPFRPDQLKAIHQSTEGWIGGLVLLSEFINRSSGSAKKLVPPDLPDRIRREVFQYFGKEIFSSLPGQVQQFLVKSSVFNPVEAGFMENLLRTRNTEEILRDLSRRNLFVQSIYDSEKGWLFRYHHLFRDYLRAKFEGVDAEERRSLLVKAAYLYEQKEDLENSIRFSLEAKAYPQAISLIEQIGTAMLKAGRKADLTHWLASLPEEMVQTNPWLLYYLAMARRFTDVNENISHLSKALNLFKEKGIVRGYILSLAYLIEDAIHIGHYHSIPVAALIKEGQTILGSLKSGEYPYERAVLWLQIGFGRIGIEGNLRSGVYACETAYLIAMELKDLSLQANALIFSIFGLACLGEFSLADENYRKLDRLMNQIVNPELRAIQLYSKIILSTNRGDFKEAGETLLVFRDYIERYGFIFLSGRELYYRCLLKVFLGACKEAEDLATNLLNQSASPEGPYLRGLAYGVFAVSRYHQGQYEQAKEFARQALDILSSEETRTETHFYWHKQMMALICHHLGENRTAEKEVEETLNYFSRILGYVSLAGSHFAAALLKSGLAKKEEASNHLRMGFQIAKERGYEHFLFLSPRDLSRACVLALELKVTEAVEYASHLLSSRLSPIAEEELKNFSSHPDPEIRETAQRIRRAIHRSNAPRLRIETFGGFRIFRGDTPMEDREWDRNLPKHLLMAIASYGTRKISKYLLIDDLWPDANPGAEERNLKLTLHRLRKSLEQAPYKEFGSSYIHLDDNHIFLDQELCQVDVDRFLSLIKKGEEHEKAGELKQALSCYTEAVEAYKGDFLPEVSNSPWIDRRRDEFRGKYIELLFALARIWEKQGLLKKAVPCYKKAIEADPLMEESYQKLMVLYSNIRMDNEAVRTYEACRKSLKEGLKTKPDPTTTALYEKIRQKLRT